jgi:hypothetical protein
MKQQTAVEWLTEKLRIEFGLVFSNNILDEAKEMEKQQIVDAYNIGFIYPIKFDFKNNKSQDAEQYYNETFRVTIIK